MCEELPCHIPTLYHHVIHFQRVPIMLCCEWCSLSPSIPDHIFTAQTPSSGEEYPEVLHYTSLYLIILVMMDYGQLTSLFRKETI